MDFLAFAREFGLPLALMGAGVLSLVKTLAIVVKGDLVVPRWVFDREVKIGEEWKQEAKRGARIAERALDPPKVGP